MVRVNLNTSPGHNLNPHSNWRGEGILLKSSVAGEYGEVAFCTFSRSIIVFWDETPETCTFDSKQNAVKFFLVNLLLISTSDFYPFPKKKKSGMVYRIG